MPVKVAVMSNKGGVGKTTVSIMLAYALRERGARVALVDIDFHGPTLPILLGMPDLKPKITIDGIVPVEIDGIRVMSIHYLLKRDDDPVLWTGDVKQGIVREMVGDGSILWGDYDVMVIDSPPSLGDENMVLLSMVDGVVLVTTPHPASVYDVRKMIRVLRLAGKPLYSIVVNMDGLFNGRVDIDYDVPVVKVPFDPEIQSNPRSGAKYLISVADRILGGGG